MKIKVIASTKANYQASKEEFDMLGGHAAGVCYMPNTFSEILNESETVTKKRITRTQATGHHSVYDHPFISLYLDQIPKLLAMLLNNENIYTASEKSARYTKMKVEGIEKKLYFKWLAIFKEEITKLYGDFYNENQIEKLAQENSRYLISVMTPTTLIYTVSYRQLNYIYGWLKKIIKEKNNKFVELLKPSIIELTKELENSGYLEEKIFNDCKNRTFSLFEGTHRQQTYFGDVYCYTYQGSLAQLAQAHRHRPINYSIAPLKEQSFFIPVIIKDNQDLVNEWLSDMALVADLIPQGMMVSINENGPYKAFILKLKERLCTRAQLEICNQTKDTLNTYLKALKNSNHYLYQDLIKYTKGARCTFDNYICNDKCHFKEGILLKRKI